jgi:chorismate lyase/3-hydroxybenzoate synthase
MKTMVRETFSGAHNQTPAAPLKIELASAEDINSILQHDDVLMMVNFSGKTTVDLDDPRQISVGLVTLGNSLPIEVWRGRGQVTSHREGRINWNENGDLMFGHMLIDEPDSSNLDVLIEQAYIEISSFVNSTAYPHVFRIWNYIPGINWIENGLERYQSFCIGRHAALCLQPDFKLTLPAASAVGTDVPGILVSFVSGNIKPIQVENSRQVSAFHYPPVYSPCSPLFSRAVLMNWNECNAQQLYISGTSSIVGHETRHTGDIFAQAGETCMNLDTLLDGVTRNISKKSVRDIALSSLRVYLRHPEQLEPVHEIISRQPGFPENIVYLKADICRMNLLLEMEGITNPV